MFANSILSSVHMQVANCAHNSFHYSIRLMFAICSKVHALFQYHLFDNDPAINLLLQY